MYQIQISNAEILDKVSILTIKNQKITDNDKLSNISKELNYLQSIFNLIIQNNIYIENLYNKLLAINIQLWNIEDHIRQKEKQLSFDNQFIDLARSIYKLNDERAKIKKQINIMSNSEFIEEKSYEKY